MSTLAPSTNWLKPPRNSYSSRPSNSPQTLSEQKHHLQAIYQEISRRSEFEIERAKAAIAERRKILRYFPDEGPLRRELYPKHTAFFSKGKEYRSRLFRAANRIGKTQAAAYETACHLMGVYPDWWDGIRFEGEPIEAWTANISWEKVRDVNQNELCGNPERPDALGTGMIPAERIVRHNYSGHTKNCMDTLAVRHVSGGVSLLQFKAYTQGRESFESNAKHLIWLDEECPEDVYTACELRTMTTGGVILLTYTPVLGLTPLTELFENEADRL